MQTNFMVLSEKKEKRQRLLLKAKQKTNTKSYKNKTALLKKEALFIKENSLGFNLSKYFKILDVQN